MSEDFRLRVSLLAASLVRSHIQLVALDFDDTLLDVHTRGSWSHGPMALSEHVRPFFRELVPAALQRGIVVCIVTFSPQLKLIQQTMRETFGAALARRILVRGSDGSWTPSPSVSVPRAWRTCSRRGKADHVLNVVAKIQLESGVPVRPEEVLLIDDLELNVSRAQLDGMCAFHFEAQDLSSASAHESNKLFQSLMATFRHSPAGKERIMHEDESGDGRRKGLAGRSSSSKSSSSSGSGSTSSTSTSNNNNNNNVHAHSNGSSSSNFNFNFNRGLSEDDFLLMDADSSSSSESEAMSAGSNSSSNMHEVGNKNKEDSNKENAGKQRERARRRGKHDVGADGLKSLFNRNRNHAHAHAHAHGCIPEASCVVQ